MNAWPRMTDFDMPRGTVRLATVALLLCTALALANLPARDFPAGWLLALVVPGALLARLPATTAPLWRALLAVALQSLALWLALEHADALSRPAALACTILPPLAFVTARQQETDGALGLFLSFCVLLVGVILDGVHVPLVLAYGVTACLTLRTTAHLAACRVSRAPHRLATPRRTGAVFASALGLALPCLVAAFAVERTIGLLPSPSRSGRTAATDAANERDRRRVGLDDSFVLDGSNGVLSDLRGEQLVLVRAVDERAVPNDLYLRSGFFAVAGLDRWQIGPLDHAVAARADSHVLRRPLPGERVHWLELDRFAGARNFVFMPPAALEIRGIDDLVVDGTREWLRQLDGSRQDVYAVAFQRPAPPPADLPLDPRGPALGLLSLPAGLVHAPFLALLDRWQVGNEPLAAAAAIAAGLAQHCRYDRIEPTGPFTHALENFLFADGDRRGYCMHFASAAAMLLRLRGIPCRIGVGLYGGEPDRSEPSARIFGSQHAHAWVEIPFAGRGYVVFDPTPPPERGRRMPSRLDTSGRLDGDAAAAANAAARNGWHALLDFVLQPWLLLVALLLAIASTLWPTGPVRRPTTPMPPVARSARRLLARLLRALSVAGHVRRHGDTLERFVHELAAQGRLLPEVHAAIRAYQEVRFGGRELDDAHAGVLQRGIAAAERMPPAATAAAQSAAHAGQT
jgi:transglutaminase-like putative cysteine protease